MLIEFHFQSLTQMPFCQNLPGICFFDVLIMIQSNDANEK